LGVGPSIFAFPGQMGLSLAACVLLQKGYRSLRTRLNATASKLPETKKCLRFRQHRAAAVRGVVVKFNRGMFLEHRRRQPTTIHDPRTLRNRSPQRVRRKRQR